MAEFGGLRKHEKPHRKKQHALVGLGSAALASAVALPRAGGSNFPNGIIKCIFYIFKTNKHGMGLSVEHSTVSFCWFITGIKRHNMHVQTGRLKENVIVIIIVLWQNPDFISCLQEKKMAIKTPSWFYLWFKEWSTGKSEGNSFWGCSLWGTLDGLCVSL